MAKAPFPMTLHFILQSESPSVVSWDYSGSSFRILDHHTFCSVILPRHFKHNKFTSFQRQLNFYSFQKRNEGPLSGAYYHPLFHRDHYNLVYQMKRTIRKHAGSEEDRERQDSSPKQAAFFTQQGGGGVTPFRPPPQLQGIPGQLAPAATVAGQQQALHAFLANSFTQQQHASMSVANQFGTMSAGKMQPTHRAVDTSWGTVFPSPHHFQNSVASSAVATSAGIPSSSTAAQSFDFKQLQPGFLNARPSTAARVTAEMQTNNNEDAAHDRSWAAVDQGAAKVAKTSESVTSIERNFRAGGSGEGPSPESLGLALSRLTVGDMGAGAFLDVAQDLISKHGCEQSLVTALKLLQRCVPNASGPESANLLQAPYAAAPAVATAAAAAVLRPAFSSVAPPSFASLVLQSQQAPPPVPVPMPMPVTRGAPQGFNGEFEMGAIMNGHGVHPPSMVPPPSYQIKQPLQLQECFVPPSASAISDHPPKVPPLPTTQVPLVWREHTAFSEADTETPEEPSFLEAKVPVTRV